MMLECITYVVVRSHYQEPGLVAPSSCSLEVRRGKWRKGPGVAGCTCWRKKEGGGGLFGVVVWVGMGTECND